MHMDSRLEDNGIFIMGIPIPASNKLGSLYRDVPWIYYCLILLWLVSLNYYFARDSTRTNVVSRV